MGFSVTNLKGIFYFLKDYVLFIFFNKTLSLTKSLTEVALTEMNEMTHLTAKQTYRVQMKTFEVRGSK